MILDRLANAGFYHSLGPGLKRAFEYLARTDFSHVPDGRHPLDGDEVFAIVQRYQPKPLTAAMWEAHRRYIDVQYVAEGVERMGYAPLDDHLPVRQDYNPERDFVFYDTRGDLFDVPAGHFVVFTPQDVHAPSLTSDRADPSLPVCKVVVKCRVGNT
jgi:YhcH/YjgK/YiaL family protein